tara:strand:- start:1131 stop:2585 length:1455 start_codon:yes stop_codon:yes gene_type:complete
MAGTEVEIPVDLRMLFMRLKWPIHRIRWIAAQKIAELVKQEETREQAVDGLLQALESARTSAECAALLNVVRVFDLSSYFTESQIRKRTRHMCLLGDYCISASYGHKRLGSGWIWSQSGRVPESFKAASYFDRRKQAVIPPAFLNRLRRLSKIVKEDLVAQWGYEWQKLMDEGEFEYSSDPHYFMGGARQEELLSADVRQYDVFFSAYMRTLHYAVAVLGMPVQSAISWATLGFSMNRGLANIRLEAATPDMQSIQAELSLDMTEEEIRKLVGASLTKRAEDEILAADLQGLCDGERCIEISIRSFLVDPGSVVDADTIADVLIENSYAFQKVHSWEYDGELDQMEVSDLGADIQELGIVPLTRFPINECFGRWHSDLMTRHIELPAAYLSESPIEIVSVDQGFDIRNETGNCGSWRVWSGGWTPSRPKGAAPALGTLTLYPSKAVSDFAASQDKELKRVIRFTVWRRKESYLPPEASVRNFII